MDITKDKLLEKLEFFSNFKFNKNYNDLTKEEKFVAITDSIMALTSKDWTDQLGKKARQRKAYYFSAEFLIGRSLGNNLLNLGIYDLVNSILEEKGDRIKDIENEEEDAALGNGGLGRLAACFLESAASQGFNLDGYGIRYSEGLFKQFFKDGFQAEEGDDWSSFYNPWSKRIVSDEKIIKFKNQTVKACPYDMPIFGYKNGQINRLRLWQAEAVNEFDFNRFNNFDYDGAVREKNEAEDLTRVLYPNDERREGKLLRIKQQYFFVSASLQDIVSNYKKNFDDKEFKHFHEYVSIQLNDTHPVIGIPELIRILLDEEKISFEDSFNIARKIFNFTNHTILREAMEVWSVDLIDETSPRVLEIIQMIEQRLVEELYNKGFKEEEINFLRIVKDDSIHMANLAIFVSNKVNGVAELHTNILKNETLKDWYGAYPYKFTNKTNGVTQRRWLIYSNMELSDFIDRKLGSNEWREDFSKIKELENLPKMNLL